MPPDLQSAGTTLNHQIAEQQVVWHDDKLIEEMEDLELQATVATVVVIVSTPAFTIKNQQQSTVSEVARPNQPPL